MVPAVFGMYMAAARVSSTLNNNNTQGDCLSSVSVVVDSCCTPGRNTTMLGEHARWYLSAGLPVPDAHRSHVCSMWAAHMAHTSCARCFGSCAQSHAQGMVQRICRMHTNLVGICSHRKFRMQLTIVCRVKLRKS